MFFKIWSSDREMPELVNDKFVMSINESEHKIFFSEIWPTTGKRVLTYDQIEIANEEKGKSSPFCAGVESWR